MTTLRIKGYVYAEKCVYPMYGHKVGEYRMTVLSYRSEGETWGVCVGEIDMPYTLPEGFDIEAEALRQQIAALEAEKEEAGRVFAEKVARINRKLAELQAIENKPCEVTA